MAKEYFEELSTLLEKIDLKNAISESIEVKHFFSGAALYVDKSICVSWSPTGLAFKLPRKECEKLIDSGKAIPLKYFAKGHVKKGYAVFERPNDMKPSLLKKYFIKAVKN